MAQIRFGEELHRDIRSGAAQLTNVVAHNYGPIGRNTIMDQKHDLPIVANSGRKVLTDFALEEEFASIGATLVRDAALKVGEEYGDGTITCTILANALLNGGYQRIAAGCNPVLLRKGLLCGLDAAVKAIEEVTAPCDRPLLEMAAARIAKDAALGALAMEACTAAGAEGVVTVLDSQGRDTHLNIWDGARYEYGLYGREFIRQEATKSTELHNCRVLLVNRKIRDIREIGNIVVQASQTHTPLLMVVSDIEEDVVKILAANVAAGRVQLALAHAPGYGDTCRRHMFALAAKTGAPVIEENNVPHLEKCGLEVCGQVEYARVDMETTLLRGFPLESLEMVQMLTGLVKKQMASNKYAYEREQLQLTAGILNGKHVEIIAGGITEYEMFEKKYLLENAVHAIQNMKEHGIVPGGGQICIHAQKALTSLLLTLKGDELEGAKCLQDALLEPARHLAENAGMDGSPVVQRLLECDDPWTGYDAATGEMVSLRERGIVDSAKATVELLRTAVETAGSLWTTEAAIIGK